MFGFIIVTDKIAGAVIELDRKGAIVVRVQLLMSLGGLYILSPLRGL